MKIEVVTDQHRHDIDAIHAFLTRTYWSPGITRDIVARAVRNSLSFSLFADSRQIGFARLITDRATFAYLADVYVLEEFRGKGLGRTLVNSVMNHPDAIGMRRYLLATRDAHGLYEKVGFKPLATPDVFMEINRPNVYLSPSERSSTTHS